MQGSRTGAVVPPGQRYFVAWNRAVLRGPVWIAAGFFIILTIIEWPGVWIALLSLGTAAILIVAGFWAQRTFPEPAPEGVSVAGEPLDSEPDDRTEPAPVSRLRTVIGRASGRGTDRNDVPTRLKGTTGGCCLSRGVSRVSGSLCPTTNARFAAEVTSLTRPRPTRNATAMGAHSSVRAKRRTNSLPVGTITSPHQSNRSATARRKPADPTARSARAFRPGGLRPPPSPVSRGC